MGALAVAAAGVTAACAECMDILSAVIAPAAKAPATAIATALRLNVLACIDLLLKLWVPKSFSGVLAT
jgi:hypothetical protein